MMKKSFLLFLLIFLTLILPSFSDEKEDMQNIYQKGMELYNAGSYEKAFQQFQEALKAYKNFKEQDDADFIQLHLMNAACLTHTDRGEEALLHYQKALEHAKKSGNVQEELKIRTGIANQYTGLKKYNEAFELYMDLSHDKKKMGLDAEARQLEEYAGYMKFLAGSYNESYQIFQRAVENISSDRNPQEIAWLYAMRGSSHYYMENRNEALEDYKTAVSFQEKLPESIYLGQYYGWLGKIATESGNYQDAMKYIDRSIEIAVKTKSRSDETLGYAAKGFLYANLKKYEKAAEEYEKSLIIIKEIQNTEFLKENLESLAWIYGELNNYKKSEEIYRDLLKIYENNPEKQANTFNSIALTEYYQKNPKKAIQHYQKSLEIFRKLDRKKNIAVVLTNMSIAYSDSGQMDRAAAAFEERLQIGSEEESLETDILNYLTIYKNGDKNQMIQLLINLSHIYENNKDHKKLAVIYNNIGYTYYISSNYSDAIKYYKLGLNIKTDDDMMKNRAILLHNAGQSYMYLSQYDRSIQHYESSLKISEKYKLENIHAGTLNSMGELYRAWGWPDKSNEYFLESIKYYKKNNDIGGQITVYNNLGQAVRQRGNPGQSLEYYDKALELIEKSRYKDTLSTVLSNIGEAYRESGNVKKARSYYIKALKIDSENHNQKNINIRRNNLALLLAHEKKYRESIPYFSDALNYFQSTGELKEQASMLSNLGFSFFFLKEFKNAAQNFENAVQIHEKLRLTASGPVRKEYLASQIFVYRNLAMTYFEDNKLWESLHALELARSKSLSEQMSGELNSSQITVQDFKKIQENLSPSVKLLSISHLDRNVLQIIYMDRLNLGSSVASAGPEQLRSFYQKYGNRLPSSSARNGEISLDEILLYYRDLISSPSLSRSEKKAFEDISAFLYSLCIAPFKDRLSEGDSLIILPDGILGTVPFETLKDPSGKFLVENFKISYAQSIAVLNKTYSRKYEQNRRPLLAFGGAEYTSAGKDSTDELSGNTEGLRNQAEAAISRGESTRAFYNKMGFGSWKNLPGTLKEVEELAKIIENSDTRTGNSVSESQVKQMSEKGNLSGYKILHFAVHGVVIPEAPELSALVLSLSDEAKGANDGYLTMKEVSSLKLKADFVNLSACNTGLGKIYEGEGVVGLTQAFLIA